MNAFSFYDAVSIIDDVIRTANSFLYTAKFIFVGVGNNKTQQIRRGRTKCWHKILKITNSAGRIDNLHANARKLSCLPTSLNIFDIRQS